VTVATGFLNWEMIILLRVGMEEGTMDSVDRKRWMKISLLRKNLTSSRTVRHRNTLKERNNIRLSRRKGNPSSREHFKKGGKKD